MKPMMKKEENPQLPALPSLNGVRRYYIYNADHVNKAKCVEDGRESVTKGDYKIVEVHKHGAGTDCPGVYLKDRGDKCFRFGKGIG